MTEQDLHDYLHGICCPAAMDWTANSLGMGLLAVSAKEATARARRERQGKALAPQKKRTSKRLEAVVGVSATKPKRLQVNQHDSHARKLAGP
ncbi:hypothetical protein [Aquabacterium sp. A08]|uniref:hypothetical protein n=1 Tax=Aquabacterium sp. A08 TaxID=2718532 RepID=UPI001422AE64|nr:hypothetical protein [Aquabacterium sp. A08]NIC43318.1 hypothetical protein [Aquabacterium sp. A08]